GGGAGGEEELGGALPQLPVQEPEARPIFDKLAVGILVYRLNQLCYANPAFLQLTGHRNLDALIEAGGLDALAIEPIASAATGGDRSLTLAIDGRDKIGVRGELIEITWQGEPAPALMTDAGTGLELAQSEIAELRSILDVAPDGVVLLDPQGTIVSANRSAEALFGYEELAGRPLADLLAPESAELARNDLASLGRAEGAAGRPDS